MMRLVKMMVIVVILMVKAAGGDGITDDVNGDGIDVDESKLLECTIHIQCEGWKRCTIIFLPVKGGQKSTRHLLPLDPTKIIFCFNLVGSPSPHHSSFSTQENNLSILINSSSYTYNLVVHALTETSIL